MSNPQGTQWETQIVNAAHKIGLKADRFPKRGQAGEPDLYIGKPSDSGIPVVFWKRLVGKKTPGKPRKPDGERTVVIIGAEDFMYMVRELENYRNGSPMADVTSIMVQAKWTAALNPTRTLWLLRCWLRAAKLRNS